MEKEWKIKIRLSDKKTPEEIVYKNLWKVYDLLLRLRDENYPKELKVIKK